MIPEFPEFKKIELSDKEDIEKFTSAYPPYSDFNFVSMWSWDIRGEMRISQLNNNLVVRFTDYVTGKPFYSFLGNHNTNDTAEKILKLSEKEGLKIELKLVPEDSISELDKLKFKIEEDRDHFDYVLPTSILKDFNSINSLDQRKKRAIKSLVRDHSPTIEILDISNEDHQRKIFEFIKESMPDDKVIENEFLAISRFIKGYRDPDILLMGAFVNSKLVGFCFSEILGDKFSNFHFWKADIKNYKPMYSFLLQEKAKLLSNKHNSDFLNIEQDLGIENLRKWKSSFGSQFYLKKYIVSFV